MQMVLNNFELSVYNSIFIMGHQQSALNGLNCKVKENNQKAEVIHNKEFFLKQHKKKQVKEQPQFVQNSFPTQNLIGNKSPRNQLTRATSQKNISSKSSRQQTVKPKIFIPQHQSITKVSQTAFPGSVKQKKFYVEQKLKSLGEIIQPRYNTTKHFPYSQILSLTETLVYSLAYMAKKNCNHHDFYPTNIFYVQGKFKVVNPLQVQASGFYLTSQRERFSFLAPELIISILQQVTQEDIGGYVMNKADVFSVGMILLEICSLQPSSECYDEESYNIVDSVIRDRLAKVVKVYTPVMAECINLMLQYEVDGRLDPVTLAQLVHWKIQNQKMTAMQMESPKPPQQGPQQGPPGKKGPMPQQGPPPGYPPNMLPPQQLRGPPPPPYMHQPFKLQNLNQNVIAVTVPNEQFTRIGPNNQGFLSSSSLQQKLRVIELIKEHPEEDQEAERQQNSRQEGAEQSNIADQKSQQNIYAQQKQLQYQQQQILQQQQVKKIVMVDKEEVNRPQYPMVESIYNEKPPMQQGSYEYEQKVNMMKPQLTKTQQRPILNPLTSYPQPMPKVYEENPPTRQQFTQEPKPSQAQVPRQQPYTIASLGQDPRTKYQAPYQPPSDLYSRPQPSQKFSLPQSYGISSPSISSPKHSPNIYTGTQQFQMQSQPLYEQIGTKKYGTSFQKNETVSDNASSTQTETLEERVQRVLNMSRNAR